MTYNNNTPKHTNMNTQHKYFFVIPETGHKRSYKTMKVCMYQAERLLKSLICKGLIFHKPRIEYYTLDNGKLQIKSVYEE